MKTLYQKITIICMSAVQIYVYCRNFKAFSHYMLFVWKWNSWNTEFCLHSEFWADRDTSLQDINKPEHFQPSCHALNKAGKLRLNKNIDALFISIKDDFHSQYSFNFIQNLFFTSIGSSKSLSNVELMWKDSRVLLGWAWWHFVTAYLAYI